MNSSLIFAFALVGSVAGAAYAVLGIWALKHRVDATESDRTVGWTLWWFAESRKYTERGRNLCRLGGGLFLLGALSWLFALFGGQ